MKLQMIIFNWNKKILQYLNYNLQCVWIEITNWNMKLLIVIFNWKNITIIIIFNSNKKYYNVSEITNYNTKLYFVFGIIIGGSEPPT